jgi:hypothetical protein
MYTKFSEIILNIDDINGYGPEAIQIFKINKYKYYLFSVHNFSYYKNLKENFNDEFNLTIKFNDNKISVSPKNIKLNAFWYDGFIIHDEKIFIIDKFNLMRNSNPDLTLNNEETQNIIDEFNNSSQIIDLKCLNLGLLPDLRSDTNNN